jgi:hypothetical protein
MISYYALAESILPKEKNRVHMGCSKSSFLFSRMAGESTGQMKEKSHTKAYNKRRLSDDLQGDHLPAEFKVAGMKVEPGTRERGFLRVGPYFATRWEHQRRWIMIPFTAIRGTREGPTLTQVAGCHPTEYAGIDATVKLSNAINPEELRGTYVAVPCVNIPGFFERTYINPIDGKNIQGLYPGRTDGTISDLIAYTIFNEVVLKADYFLDCHGGDIMESEVWYMIYYKTDDEVEKRSEAMARAAGFTYIAKSHYPGGMGFEAAKRGKPGTLFECTTGCKLLPEESSAVFEGTLNVMRHLGMLEGQPKPIKNQPATSEGQRQEIWTQSASTHFTQGGLYHSRLNVGDILQKGEIIGTVTNFWGEVVETIHAPATGRVRIMVHNPVVNPGDNAVTVCF